MGAKASTPGYAGGSASSARNSSTGQVISSTSSQRNSNHVPRLRTQSSSSPQPYRRSPAYRFGIYGQNANPGRHDRSRARSLHYDHVSSDEDGADDGEGTDTSGNSRHAAALRAFLTQSILLSGLRCPLCKRMSTDYEQYQNHVTECLSKPRLTYNVDKIATDRDEECVVCFETFSAGDLIARLPCLCIYHKHCIDGWFKVNRTCPQHPNADPTAFESSTLMGGDTSVASISIREEPLPLESSSGVAVAPTEQQHVACGGGVGGLNQSQAAIYSKRSSLATAVAGTSSDAAAAAAPLNTVVPCNIGSSNDD